MFFFPNGKVKIKGNVDFRQRLNRGPGDRRDERLQRRQWQGILHLGHTNTLIDFTLVK